MPELLCAPLPFTVSALGGGSTGIPANLGNERLGRTWVFGTGTTNLLLDLGSAQAIDTLALLASNLTTGDTVRWRAAASSGALNGQTSPPGPILYDSGTVPFLASPEGAQRVHRNSLVFVGATPMTARWWQATIVAANAAPFIGRAVLGLAFRPAEMRDYGWDRRIVDMGTAQRSQTGLEDPLVRAKVMEFSWAWSGLTKAEADGSALNLMAYAGVTRDLLVCLDTDAADKHNAIGYGKLTEPAVHTNYAEGWYELSCQLLSRLALAL